MLLNNISKFHQVIIQVSINMTLEHTTIQDLLIINPAVLR
jgi:hypothetical protein